MLAVGGFHNAKRPSKVTRGYQIRLSVVLLADRSLLTVALLLQCSVRLSSVCLLFVTYVMWLNDAS